MFVNFNILNQLGSPAINSNTFANRPAAGQTGRLFVSTDTFEIYRDNGTTWDLIGGPGTSTITGTGTATQVAYFTSSQAIGSSANLFWDNTNTRLGVGTATPSYTIEANGSIKANSIYLTGATGGSGALYWTSNRVTLANYNVGGILVFENNGGVDQMNLDVNGALVIGNGTTAANTSSILDLTSTTRGFLQPRMTTAERNLIATPATGLTVYNTTSNTIDYYNGTSWISLSTTTGTVTGTGTATQVAFWSASSTISGSNNLYWDNVTGSLGINTNTPGAELDIHGTGVIAQLNSTSATANSLLAFQRSGTGVWRIGDQYNGGSNFFELHNTVLINNALQVLAASNEATFFSTKTYTTGNAIGVAVQHNLTIPNGTNVGVAAIGGVNSNLNLSLGGNTTVAATGRQGLEGSTSISFTGAGTLTMTQGSTVRAFSALGSVYAFNGSAVGTITHLAGLRICFPDNVGSALNITNNYALLINDQTTGTGTVTYTNRWGIYQEGASDLNYLAANLLIGSTTNSGEALQVTGTAKVTSTLTANSLVKSGGTASQILAADGSVITAGTNITIAAGTISASGGITGSGTTNYIPKFTSSSAIGNSIVQDLSTYIDINGNVRAQQGIFYNPSATTNTTYIGHSNTGAYLGTAAAKPLYFETNGSERIRITSSGPIGIGTTTPGSTLQVNGNAAIGYSASTAAPTNGLQVAGATNLNGTVTIADTINLVFSTGTGTKIGTATSQKLSFWNATPIVQPTTGVASAARVGGGGATVTDTDTFGGYTIAQVVQALQNTGILA